MSLGTIAGTRMWGCAGPFAIADSCQGARSRFVPPWDAWLICDHGALRALANHPTGRFAHWPIIPRGSLNLRQSSLDRIDNAFAHMLERMFNSTECGGINLGDIPRGSAPWDVPSVDPSTLGKNFHMRTRFAHALPQCSPTAQRPPKNSVIKLRGQ